MGPNGRFYVISFVLEGDSGIHPHSLIVSWLPWGGQFRYTVWSQHHGCLLTEPDNQPWPETSKPMTNTKPSCFSLDSLRYFIAATRNSTELQQGSKVNVCGWLFSLGGNDELFSDLSDWEKQARLTSQDQEASHILSLWFTNLCLLPHGALGTSHVELGWVLWGLWSEHIIWHLVLVLRMNTLPLMHLQSHRWKCCLLLSFLYEIASALKKMLLKLRFSSPPTYITFYVFSENVSSKSTQPLSGSCNRYVTV